MKSSSLTAITLLTLVLLLLGCKPEPPAPSEDLVLFTIPDQPMTLKTVDTFTSHTSGCNNLPTPNDSSASLLIDLDRDNKNDIIITLTHFYNDTLIGGPTTPCDSFQYYATIKGLHFLDSVAIAPNIETNADLFEEGEDIDASLSTWGRIGYLFNSDPSGNWRQDFTGVSYIGFKLRWIDEWNMAWIKVEREENTLQVLEYAINLSRNRPLQAGQRQ